MELAGIWRAFAEVAGPAAVSALWQGLAVALGLAVLLRLIPRISARDRFRAWAAGFLALAALPFLPAMLFWVRAIFAHGTIAAGSAAGVSEVLPGRVWLDLAPFWSFVIAGVWTTASLARAVDLGVHTVRLRRLWKQATPVRTLPERISGRSVEVCATRELDRPSVIGFFAPRILIPEWLLGRLTDEELEQVVLHEAEHLRRRDDWINLAQKLCLVVFPLNPALAWMERRLCREREMACDEAVVRRTRAPRAYAACLASLAERGLERRVEALSLGAWQRRPELVVRVQQILRRAPGLHPALARTLLGVVSCGLVLGSVELARCPQLVSFTATSAPEMPMQANVPATAAGTAMSGFRAYNAVAHVPSRAELAAQQMPHRKSAAKRNEVRWSPTLATEKTGKSGARRQIAKTEVPPAGQPQQWVVFTAWQQVESAGPAVSSMADTQAGDAVLNPQTTAAMPGVQPVREYTVTQVILSVYQAGPANPTHAGAVVAKPGVAAPRAAETSAARSRSATIPMVPLPAAIPVRDGWLVIQL